MTTSSRSARAIQRRSQTFETLEFRQALSAAGAGVQLLPAGFDPAAYAAIGPRLTPEASSPLLPAAADQLGDPERFASDEEFADTLIELAVRRYAQFFGQTLDHFPPFLFVGWPSNGWENFGAEGVALVRVTHSDSGTGSDLRPLAQDGQYVYLLQDQELLIFSASPAGQPMLVSRTKIQGYPGGIFLEGDRLTVVSLNERRRFLDSGFPSLGSGREREANHVAVFDVAERAQPRLRSQTDLDGQFAAARFQGGQLHLTLANDVLLPAPLTERIEESSGVIPGLWTVETEATPTATGFRQRNSRAKTVPCRCSTSPPAADSSIEVKRSIRVKCCGR